MNLFNCKKLVLSLLILVCFWFLYPVARVGFFFFSDPIPNDRVLVANPWIIDDASGKNLTRHGGIVRLPKDINQSITLLQETFAKAKKEGKNIIPFGARHSMGKQSLKKNAFHIDLKNLCGIKMEAGLVRVEAGARWKEVLKFLAPKGLTVEIMQSNADFSIGGSLSVNAHGWQPDRPPISSTVLKIRMLTSNGEIKICSRTENQKIFQNFLGGYGLIGILLEAWIKPIENEILRSSHQLTSPSQFLHQWQKMKGNDVRLAFGRISLAPNSFFEKILLVSYESTKEVSHAPIEINSGFRTSLSRAIFRASLGSSRGKSFRDWMENLVGGEAGGTYPRANLMIEPVRVFANNQKNKSDMLLEIFIPQEKLAGFIPKAANLLRDSSDELLNVTVREITKDTDTALPYAKENVFGLVMLFTLDHEVKTEKRFSELSRKLIELALLDGGTFYLPYRNYATASQLHRSYPELESFLEMKTLLDPETLFSSGFYDYLKQSRKDFSKTAKTQTH